MVVPGGTMTTGGCVPGKVYDNGNPQHECNQGFNCEYCNGDLVCIAGCQALGPVPGYSGGYIPDGGVPVFTSDVLDKTPRPFPWWLLLLLLVAVYYMSQK